MAIAGENNFKMLCDKLVEFTSREEVDAIQQQLLEDVNDSRKQTENGELRLRPN